MRALSDEGVHPAEIALRLNQEKPSVGFDEKTVSEYIGKMGNFMRMKKRLNSGLAPGRPRKIERHILDLDFLMSNSKPPTTDAERKFIENLKAKKAELERKL
jgi:hypothetical protein